MDASKTRTARAIFILILPSPVGVQSNLETFTQILYFYVELFGDIHFNFEVHDKVEALRVAGQKHVI